MDVKQVLAEMNLNFGINDVVTRTVPVGCCGSIIDQNEHTIKSVGIYQDSFGRKMLVHELSNGDFLPESDLVLVRKAGTHENNSVSTCLPRKQVQTYP